MSFQGLASQYWESNYIALHGRFPPCLANTLVVWDTSRELWVLRGIKEKLGLLLVPTFPAPRHRAVVAVESRQRGGFRRVTTMPGGQTQGHQKEGDGRVIRVGESESRKDRDRDERVG